MAINWRRNKPFGPGGSTRRLHQFQGSEVRSQKSEGRNPDYRPLTTDTWQRGRTRIDEGVKGALSLGMVPPLSGLTIVANDNYAPVAQAA